MFISITIVMLQWFIIKRSLISDISISRVSLESLIYSLVTKALI